MKQKSPHRQHMLPAGADFRGTTLIYHSDTKHKDDGKRKAPVRMIGQGRNRGTTLHYTLKACPVTGTSVLIYGNSFNQEAHE